MKYKEEKIREFHEDTLNDYYRSLIIEDVAKVMTTEKTDGKFIQIGIRPLIDDEMFIAENFVPRLPSAGRIVAIGERDYLIKSILENDRINRIKFNEDVKEFPKEIYDISNAIILLSTKFHVKIFTELIKRIDYKKGYPRLDGIYKIVSVPEKVLGNKIIILEKDSILWKKEVFENEITGKKEKIDIKIKLAPNEKVDITIRSINKIEYIDPKSIKILEVIDKNEK